MNWTDCKMSCTSTYHCISKLKNAMWNVQRIGKELWLSTKINFRVAWKKICETPWEKCQEYIGARARAPRLLLQGNLNPPDFLGSLLGWHLEVPCSQVTQGPFPTRVLTFGISLWLSNQAVTPKEADHIRRFYGLIPSSLSLPSPHPWLSKAFCYSLDWVQVQVTETAKPLA